MTLVPLLAAGAVFAAVTIPALALGDDAVAPDAGGAISQDPTMSRYSAPRPINENPYPSGPPIPGSGGQVIESPTGLPIAPDNSAPANSDTAYAANDTGEAKALLGQEFDEVLASLENDPGRGVDPESVEQYLPGNAAIIDAPGEQPSTVVVSTVPLRDEDEAGDLQPVDLDLERDGQAFEPHNSLTDVDLPTELGQGIRIESAETGAQTTVQLDDPAAEAATATRLGDDLFYHEAAKDTDLLVAPLSEGVEVFTQIRSAEAPEIIPFRLDLPVRSSMQSVDGGLDIVRDAKRQLQIRAPWAIDAEGKTIDVSMRPTADGFELVVPHREAGRAYPILVDPQFFEDWWNWNWSEGGNPTGRDPGIWGLHGYNALNGYYSPDTASPFYGYSTCWSGWQQYGAPCWGTTQGLYLYTNRFQGYTGGDWAEWEYAVPGYYDYGGTTAYITGALAGPVYYARNGDNCCGTPHAYFGLHGPGGWNPGWPAYLTTEGVAGARYALGGGVGMKRLVFGMAASGDRSAGSIQGYRTAALGGALIELADSPPGAPVPPSMSDPVPPAGAHSLDTWFGEDHAFGNYDALIQSQSPALYWQFGDASNTASDSSGNSNNGYYDHGGGRDAPGAVPQGGDDLGGAIDLNGSDEYIWSSYSTRRNLVTNPSIEIDKTGWVPYLSSAGSLTRSTTQAETGAASLKAASQAPSQGAIYKTSASAGYFYSATAELRGAPNVGGLVFWLCYMNGTQQLRCDDATVNDGAAWGRAEIRGEDFGYAPAGTNAIWLFATNEAATSQTFYVDSVQLEREWNLSPYFDGSSGNSRWEGTPNNSTSTRTDGPFASGGTRTFEGWANRDSEDSYDTLFSGGTSGGGSGTAGLYLGGEGGTQPSTVYWAPNWGAPEASWDGAWPGADQWVHWALVYDDAAHSSELFINGVSQGVRTVPSSGFGPTPGDFSAGSWPVSGWTPQWSFDGKLDEFAIYERALSSAEISQHTDYDRSNAGWVQVASDDVGLGIKDMQLTYPARSGTDGSFFTKTVDYPVACTGTRSGTLCDRHQEHQFRFNANSALLKDGITAVTVRSEDAAGNSTTKTFDAKADHTTPEVLPITGGLRSQSSPGYDLHVEARDGTAQSLADRSAAQSGVKRIDLYMDRSTHPDPIVTTGDRPCAPAWGSCPLSLDYTLDPQSATEDDHQFQVVAVDQLGHKSPPSTWSQFVENAPPTVETIGGSMAQGWITGGTVDLKVTAKDLGFGVKKIAVDFPGASGPIHKEYDWEERGFCNPRCPTNPTASWDIPASLLAEGIQAIDAKAYGKSDDVSQPLTAQFRVDRTPAEAGIGGPENWLRTGSETIEVGGRNPVAGVNHVTLILPGGQEQSYSFDCSQGCPEEATHSFPFDVTALPNGSGQAMGHAYGPGGVASDPAVQSLKIDHANPDVSASGPLFDGGMGPVGTEQPTVLDVTDEGSGLDQVDVLVDGNVVVTRFLGSFPDDAQDCVSGQCSFHSSFWPTLDEVSYGQHSIDLRVTDVAGNTDTVSASRVIDSTPPSLDLSGPLADADAEPLTVDSALANITGADAGSGIRRITVSVGDQQVASYPPEPCVTQCPSTLDATYNFVKADWGPGPHEVNFEAIDASGNRAVSALTADQPADAAELPECPTTEPEEVPAVDVADAGQVAASVAAEPESPLAETVPTTDPETGETLDPALRPADPQTAPDPSIAVTGTRGEGAASDDPGAGMTISDTVCIRPGTTTPAETQAELYPGSGQSVADVHANVAPQTDSIYRPTPVGAALILNMRGESAPRSFRWNVQLGSGQQLEELDSGGVAIVDTTVPDVNQCNQPAPVGDPTDLSQLADAEIQLSESERNLCGAEQEIDDGHVEAVFAAPLGIDEDGEIFLVTLNAVQIAGAPPYIIVDMPVLPNPNKKRKVLIAASAALGGNDQTPDCQGIPSPCGAYSPAEAVHYAVRWGGRPNPAWQDYFDNDCTNFMSQILNAGNLQYMNEYDQAHPEIASGSWFAIKPHLVPPNGIPQWNTLSWLLVDGLVQHLWKWGLVEKVSHDPSDFRGGDLIAMNWNWTDNGRADDVFDHFQMVTRGGQNGDDPQMAQHSTTDYSGYTWHVVKGRVFDAGHGKLWHDWGYIVLRPVHSRANVGAQVRSGVP